MFFPQYCSLMPHVSFKLLCPQYWCPIVRHWAHSTNWFQLYWPMTIYITADLINCFHQMWDTLSQMKFVNSTTIIVSLSFMSTPLALVMILNKAIIPFLWNTHQIVNCRLLEPSKDWMIWHNESSWSWCLLRYQLYLVIIMNMISENMSFEVWLCFDHVNEKSMIIWVRCLVGLLFRHQFDHSVTVHSVTIHKVTEWTSW